MAGEAYEVASLGEALKKSVSTDIAQDQHENYKECQVVSANRKHKNAIKNVFKNVTALCG